MTRDLTQDDQPSAETAPGTSLSALGRLLPQNMSRRSFGKLLGAQTLLASTASALSLSGCGGGDGGSDPAPAPVDPGTQTLTRAAFVATISDYFDWVHSSEYVDFAKNVQPTFVDVVFGVTPYAKQIETALEEAVVDNSQGYFYPDKPATREDVAVMYVKAFKIPLSTTNALAAFSDAGAISAAARASVNALVAAGYMKGSSATQFSPTATVTANDAKAILNSITTAVVSPPQVMCKTGTTAGRRYERITTPTAGATIYYTLTKDGSTPADPTTASSTYDFTRDGVLQLTNPLGTAVDSRVHRLKTMATKAGMANSVIREFTWNIVRPVTGKFQAKLVHAATATTPTVWIINNPSEFYQAHVFYIEGSTKGIVFDAGEYALNSDPSSNLKTYIDTIATKPYISVLGHNHPDHSEQIDSFAVAGIPVYISAIEKASLAASSRADFKHAASVAITLTDGQVFDLGNCQVTAWQAPGHTNGLTTLLINQAGWAYASDHFGCNRAYTADTTQYNGTKVDLQLSLSQQLVSNYKKSSTSGLLTEVTNAHQEIAVGMPAVQNFLQCFQQLIDKGDAASAPSIRGGTAGKSRMSMVGDMWRNKNWMAVGNSLGSNLGLPIDYFTAPTTAYPCGATIDYNAADGYKKYSVLSNIEIAGGTLVGVNVYWAAPANGIANSLPNKFDPWTYDYTINVPAASNSIVITPTAMSNIITSMKVNGSSVAQGSSTSVAVSAGSKITIDIVAADGITKSSYTFTVAKV